MVTRLCCGQDHNGVGCPDGLVMCCLCFSRVLPEELWADEDGNKWDICKPCEASEQGKRR